MIGGIDKNFQELLEKEFIWLPEKGIGYFPPKEGIYGKDYFKNYVRLGDTEMGKKLTAKRVDWVRQFYSNGPLVDIGIGSGCFVEQRPDTVGFDVNPFGVQWLTERNVFADPTNKIFFASTFWDSLEHINNPTSILDNISKYVFVSLPIFKDGEHVIRSKHFKKGEHCWYWTRQGFVSWMGKVGFMFIGHSLFEIELGREGIETFAFERV